MTIVANFQRLQATPEPHTPPDYLRFVKDDEEGIGRHLSDKEVAYICPKGHAITRKEEIARLNALGIPPAWRDVWICADPDGHLQATGIDEAGRKQYRYHPAWRAFREWTKFRNLVSFGAHLPRIRRKVRRTFRNHDKADRDLVIAALVRLLDDAPLRIGNPNSDSDAVGASTLKRRHIAVSDQTIRLDYTAKGGKRVRRQVKDGRLLKVLDRIDDLPGHTVFRYIGEDKEIYPVRSEQVNEWLKDAAGEPDVTAKVFRTWSGSLAAFNKAVSEETITIKAMSAAASRRLRNTPAIARKSYIHPAIIDLNNTDWSDRKKLLDDINESARDLTRVETAMLRYLAVADANAVDQV